MISYRNGNLSSIPELLRFNRPQVMGVLNCTPDSFSDGGHYFRPYDAVSQLDLMVSDGATFIDVGGESTRPGSDPVSIDEELRRVIPVLEIALKRHPGVAFSIDTTKYEVAREALSLGTHFINDVSGLRNEPRFLDLSLEFGSGLMLMHSIGNPKTMQENPNYTNVVSEVQDFLLNRARECAHAGVASVIIDPGFGFGKTLEHNLELLRALNAFTRDGFPVMVGISRKSMLGTITGRLKATDRLSATVSAHFFALLQGAILLRVHDVKEAIDSIAVFEAIGFSF
jgi:dihydropteroate synthase